MSDTKQTYCIDASSLRLTACPQKFINAVVRGLRMAGEKNFKPAFGIAYHKYKADYLDTGNHSKAMQKALLYYKDISSAPPSGIWSLECLASVILKDERTTNYYTVLRNKDGKALVEQKFKIPVYEDDHLIICLSGTIDALVMCQGQACFVDHKVTQSWSTDEFIGKYINDHQMMMYSYVLNKLALEQPETFGMFNGAPFFISMIQLTKTDIKFITSPVVSILPEKMEYLEDHIAHAVGIILDYHHDKSALVHRNYSQCSVYGSCTYFPLCAGMRADEDFTIANQYITKPYDPLKFDEEN